MAAATAHRTSDACIVASSLSLARWQTLQAVQSSHNTKLAIESRGGATGRARLNRDQRTSSIAPRERIGTPKKGRPGSSAQPGIAGLRNVKLRPLGPGPARY